MVSAKDARDWARSGGLRGIGDSLYTPFSGVDGDDIDFDAYRTLIRYCLDDLDHDLLWLTSGVGEWWALTVGERKELLEVAVEEARTIKPNTIVQSCAAASCAKDALELTLHAQEHGADMVYLQTPTMEVHGGEGMLRFFQYIAERSDIALGMFNSPASGYVMTGAEMAAIYHAVPAVIAVKEGVMDSFSRTLAMHALAPELLIWECDTFVYEAGWLQDGIVAPAQLGNISYLLETPDNPVFRKYWELIWDGQLEEARRFRTTDPTWVAVGNYSPWMYCYPGRPDYAAHWGISYKIAAEAIGLPIGDYHESRPPQGALPEEGRVAIRALYEQAGMIGAAANSRAVKGTS